MTTGVTGLRWVLFFLVALVAGTVHADLFKCLVDGATVFQDHPCAAGAQEDLCAPGISATRHPDICGGSLAAVQDQGDTGSLGLPAPRYPAGTSALPDRSYPGYSGGAASGGRVGVQGYTRKDGTYVRPHTRSAPKRR